ncbi:MAG: type II secretion system protein [Candidatus Competibacteraceae bacterium]
MKRPADCRGFSLLEVLVAFAILSLTLGVLLQVFATGLRNTANAEDYTRAVLQAESLLAQVGITLPVESQQGEIDERFQWTITVTPFPVENMLDPETPTESVRFTPIKWLWKYPGRSLPRPAPSPSKPCACCRWNLKHHASIQRLYSVGIAHCDEFDGNCPGHALWRSALRHAWLGEWRTTRRSPKAIFSWLMTSSAAKCANPSLCSAMMSGRGDESWCSREVRKAWA